MLANVYAEYMQFVEISATYLRDNYNSLPTLWLYVTNNTFFTIGIFRFANVWHAFW